MTVNVFKQIDEVIEGVAQLFITGAQQAIAERGQFNVSLSGGSSPKKLYELLASNGYKEKIEWNKVYFFFGDERYVAHDHPESNFLMAQQALFTPLSIQEEQVFKV